MSDIGGEISKQYMKSTQSAITSITFAAVAAPLLGSDNAAWYFLRLRSPRPALVLLTVPGLKLITPHKIGIVGSIETLSR
jgi:hypothetical protein